MAKKLAVVDRSCCVSCGACRKVCPKSAISICRGVYAQVDDTACVGCSLCSKTCPAGAISMDAVPAEGGGTKA